jgi:hypothetical protein
MVDWNEFPKSTFYHQEAIKKIEGLDWDKHPQKSKSEPEPEEDNVCKRCRITLLIPADLEPTEYCNLCAQELVEEQEEEIERLTANLNCLLNKPASVTCPKCGTIIKV